MAQTDNALVAVYYPSGTENMVVLPRSQAIDVHGLTLADVHDVVNDITPVIRIKTVDETRVNTTAMSSDSDLFFTAVTGEEWIVEVVLYHSDTVAQFALTAPSGSTGFITAFNQFGMDSVGIGTSFSFENTGVTAPYVCTARIVAGGDGIVGVQWAQKTAGGTSTLKRGSVLKAARLLP